MATGTGTKFDQVMKILSSIHHQLQKYRILSTRVSLSFLLDMNLDIIFLNIRNRTGIAQSV
jgi:two-component SAPR family response regulator